MKHKVVWTVTICFAIIFTALFVTTLCFGFSIDVKKEIDNLIKTSSEATEYLTLASQNINSSFGLAHFIFGVEGISSIINNHSFNTAFFTLMWSFFLPLLGVILGSLSLIVFSLFFVERIKRQFKYQYVKKTGIIGMYISFSCFLLLSLIAIVLMSILETQFNSNDGLKSILDSINLSNVHNGFSYITIIKYWTNNGLSKMINGGIKNIEGLDFTNINTSMLSAAMIICIIGLPITLILSIVFNSIWISTFISSREGGMSKFTLWLQNVRIDSKREFYGAIFKNIWVLTGLILFITSIIFPGIVHPYQNSMHIVLTVSSLIVLPIALIPLLICWIKIIRIQRFNFNKMMFIQMLIFTLFNSSMQLIVWVLFREEMNMPLWMILTWPFIYISLSAIITYGFIKWKS
ncbi:motility-associated protein Scm1 [Spiroplasma culicicola]|uniref:Motility-associated protein Scm1 n=1 Tax=Spiroplasma culicicola AES-1 TaxID=1276246 RepID=W6A6V2_9MOLU|nr:motility-associated protein Scm1 [Spiroplasma culicicola]AHI52858.1 hypothetical protein SCULI_v1c05170 [Spiroplasma culicicola AES-1]